MRVESGPKWGDPLHSIPMWWLVASLLILIWAGLCVKDYYVGWPQKNREEAAAQISRVVGAEYPLDPKRLGPHPDEDEFKAVRSGAITNVAELRQQWGEPLTQARTGEDIYASVYGAATVPALAGRIDADRMKWVTWFKPKREVDNQIRLWMPLSLLLALYPLSRFVQTARLRVVVDDSGVTYGRQHVPFDDIIDLRDYSPKGWVDMYYRDDGGEKHIRLDNQKIAKFNEVVEAICAKKGCPNPVGKPAPAKPE